MCKYCKKENPEWLFSKKDVAIKNIQKPTKDIIRPDLSIDYIEEANMWVMEMNTNDGLFLKQIYACPFCGRNLSDQPQVGINLNKDAYEKILSLLNNIKGVE